MAKVEITHPDKFLYPKDKITKEEVIDYYKKVSKRILPFLKDRPLVMERFPDGIGKKGFFQKNISSYFPKFISKVAVSRQSGSKGSLVLCQNQDTLKYVANLASLCLHVWLAKKGSLKNPDRLIFDLDPPKAKFDLARKAAYHLRDLLEKEYKLKAFVMTTGSKGLHVVVPLKPLAPFDEVRAFAKSIAEVISKRDPKSFTIQVRKNKRKGRVFIDYLRNSYAQHSICPYSLRALPKAPIAMPISWKELTRVEAQSFHLKNIAHRLSAQDPWKSFLKSAKKLPKQKELS